ncbi:hypothetical protein GCM10009525_32670 [Streptosporangium amethystogenes subsp. fukuiense]
MTFNKVRIFTSMSDSAYGDANASRFGRSYPAPSLVDRGRSFLATPLSSVQSPARPHGWSLRREGGRVPYKGSSVRLV